jgi:hypothetical protein
MSFERDREEITSTLGFMSALIFLMVHGLMRNVILRVAHAAEKDLSYEFIVIASTKIHLYFVNASKLASYLQTHYCPTHQSTPNPLTRAGDRPCRTFSSRGTRNHAVYCTPSPVGFNFMYCYVAGAQSQELIGRWEHRFHGDSEGEVLVIRLDNGIIKGEYLGLERAGEHGLFYFATEA